jgi:hypothetical protein
VGWCTARCVYSTCHLSHTKVKHKRTLKRGRRCFKTHAICSRDTLFCGEIIRKPINILPGERYSGNSSRMSGISAPFPVFEMWPENTGRSRFTTVPFYDGPILRFFTLTTVSKYYLKY